MIILIDNYDSFTFNLYQLLAQHDEVNVVRNDAITIEALASYQPDGLIISPGPGLPSAAGMSCDVVRYAVDSSIPLLGICLGHQAIGDVFGGTLKFDEVPVHGKSDLIFHDRQGIYQAMQLPFQAGRYHSVYVDRVSLPDCLSVTAENADGMIMGLQHKILPILGVQFHPESILTPDGAHLIESFVRAYVHA